MPSSSPATGIDSVAEMLNHMLPAEREKMLQNIRERDPILASKIEEKMFGFENLVQFDDPDIQTLLREIPQSRIELALRLASDPLKEKIFKNVSQRMAQSIRDGIAQSPKRKLSEVHEAQKQIAEIAKELLRLKKL